MKKRGPYFKWGSRLPFKVRFWRNVRKTEKCWIWTGYCRHNERGSPYPTFSVNGKMHTASRWIWEQKFGPIPKGMWVLHKCDNPLCMRPGHLFLGTPRDNSLDMLHKGRHRYKKITPHLVRRIKRMLKHCTVHRCKEHLGLSWDAVDKIRTGKTWAHIKID